MNRSLLLAATALIAAQASASQTAVTHFTLSSANGGASTLVNYSFTGSWLTGVVVQDPSGVSSMGGVNLMVTQSLPPGSATFMAPALTNGTNPYALPGSALTPYVGAISGLAFNNVTQGATRNITDFHVSGINFPPGVVMSQFLMRVANGGVIANQLPVSVGDTLTMSGATTGSFTVAEAFNHFNQGEWSATAGNFTSILTIGSAPAVPEPSTYGLALGGLALAVVAVRRRAKRV